MKNRLSGMLIFALGFIAGGSIMCYLSMKASETYLHCVKLIFEIQQEATTYHFMKAGDYQRALVHYKILADSQGDKTIYAFQQKHSPWSFSFPFTAIILKEIGESSDTEGKGKRAIEGLTRGHLAR